MAENEIQSMENRLIHGDVLEMAVEKEMQVAYLDYAMSVIVSRALPDVRDGLKPVHRRILYAMHENNITHNRAHKKSARIVGEVMGKYHPHGDSSIYMALVRMAQDFSMGTMLIDGQGNFGSIDNDPPAAMRYTEARLQKISQYLLDDLDKDTVDFKDNYDGLEKEPSVLPAGFPNILANGSEGIAVGMATSIPPYNLGEIIDACLLIVEKPGASDAEFLEILHAPDFPTGCIIVNKAETAKAVLTGRGSVIVRGKAHFEEGKKTCVVITEMPYQVVKSGLIEKIAELVKDKRIEGISNIRDESNKKGIRVVVELKKDVSPEVILNYLYKLTQLQSSFSINSLVLNANKPELMGAKAIIKTFIVFREEVIVRRLTYQLGKTRDRAHLVLGLHVAIDSIDKIIAIIRGSSDANDAKSKLLNEVWHASESVQRLIDLVGDKNNKIVNNTFKFTEEQVKSIIEMRLSRLTGLERDKLVAELEDLGASISDYLKKLGSRTEIMKIISDELIVIKNAHAIPRRTAVDNIDVNTNIEDFIERENVLVIITNNGYIKRSSIDAYRSQKRGGKGKSGINTNEDDDVAQIIASHTHSGMLFFSQKGQVYRLKTHQIPVGTNIAKGRAIVNLLPIEAGEKMATIISMPENPQEWDDYDIIFATKKGKIRRSAIKDFSNINASSYLKHN
jgi:DNA gyrase subunit A